MKIYKVQSQEVDANRRLRIYTLENMLLNVAGSNADDTGIGIQYLMQQNCTWVITNMSIEISYLPTHGEKIGIETWVENAAHMLSVRNFRIFLLDENGEVQCQIGQARSVWAVINLTDRTIQNVFDQPAFLNYRYGGGIEIAKQPHFSAIDTPDGYWQHEIVYSDIDYNGHCNSCKYLEFMLNASEPVRLKEQLPKQFHHSIAYPSPLIPLPFLRIDLKYAKELHKGEKAVVRYQWHDNNAVQYEVRNFTGEPACSARISIVETDSPKTE